MAIPWLRHQRTMDRVVDAYWAELVEFHPWNKAGYAGEGGPDTNRKVLAGDDVVAVYVTPGARVVGEISDGSAGTGTKLLIQDTWASIQQDILDTHGENYWKESDRVYWPERDEWFEILNVNPSATRRPNVMLTRLQDVDIVPVEETG